MGKKIMLNIKEAAPPVECEDCGAETEYVINKKCPHCYLDEVLYGEK